MCRRLVNGVNDPRMDGRVEEWRRRDVSFKCNRYTTRDVMFFSQYINCSTMSKHYAQMGGGGVVDNLSQSKSARSCHLACIK